MFDVAAIFAPIVTAWKKVKNWFKKPEKSTDHNQIEIESEKKIEEDLKISQEGNSNEIKVIQNNLNVNIITPEGTKPKEQDKMPKPKEDEDKIAYDSEEGVWVCSLCTYYSENKTNCKHHYRNSHKEGHHKCPDCGETFKSEIQIKNHKRNCKK